MLQYIILVLVLTILSAIAYIRIKMKFWHLQPVFHFYKLSYWLSPPGLILASLPQGNKFLNIVNITTVPILDDDDNKHLIQIDRACELIKKYFVTDTRVTYKPSKSDIMAYLKHSNEPGYMSIYLKPKMLFTSRGANPTTPDTTPDTTPNTTLTSSINTIDFNEVAAVSTARPLNVHCHVRSGANFMTYYVDNLCVLPDYREQGLAPQMIQTQCYNLRHLNKKIHTCLFKREGKLTAIVPIVAFHTAAYNMATLPFTPLHASITCTDLAVKQMNMFTEFVKAERVRFDWAIMPDISNIAGLIKAGCISIHLLMQSGQVLAAYVFRLPKLAYKEIEAIELITVIKGTSCPVENTLFLNGLGLALTQVRSKNAKVDILLVEGTADAAILRSTMSSVPTLFTCPTAFYWYNYAAYTCEPSKFLILYWIEK